MRVKDAVVGVKVENLTILEVFRKQVPIRKDSEQTRLAVVAKCRCDCGTTVELETRLIGHNTKSCGCRRERVKKKHGWCGTRCYQIAACVRWRCVAVKPGSPLYRYYRGRGVRFGFESVPAMAEHIASLPGADDFNLSLDRIDNDKGYEPGNLRWANSRLQAKNRRCSRGKYVERYRDDCHFQADKELWPTAQI